MKTKNLQKAIDIWNGLNRSERFGCQFGMFPEDKMRDIAKEDVHEVSVVLMDLAQRPNPHFWEGAPS